MRIINGQIFINGKFIRGGIDFDEKINEAGYEVQGTGTDAEGAYIIPGLIDIHTHAAFGEDVSDGKPEALPVLAGYYASRGVTSWCPTTMTLGEHQLTTAVKAIADYKRPEGAAKIAGINLEGPFLSGEKKGAQNSEYLRLPDFNMFRRLYDASEGRVKLITVAPELTGAIGFIEKASELVTVSIGHTAADYETAANAFKAGASHTTHLFNGMPPLHHRNPGIIGAAFDCGATAELITDGLHIDPAVIRITNKLFKNRLCLISDSLRCAGMPEGDYELGGQIISLKNGKACLKGTDTLAGSSIHLMDGLKRAVSFGISLEDAVTAASLTPARVIKYDNEAGSLEKGKWADFVILDENLNVLDVYINGKRRKS